MMQSLSLRLANNRKFLPLAATIALFVIAFVGGMILFPAMRDGQSFFNLFITTPFLLILVVGEGLVIISGGIDLSVSGVLALTTVASAALLRDGWDPLVVIALMLADGHLFGAVHGRVHRLPQGAAVHRDARRHVACTGPVLHHQRQRGADLRPRSGSSSPAPRS